MKVNRCDYRMASYKIFSGCQSAKLSWNPCDGRGLHSHIKHQNLVSLQRCYVEGPQDTWSTVHQEEHCLPYFLRYIGKQCQIRLGSKVGCMYWLVREQER